MIKGNESLVNNFNFYFLTQISHIFKMLHFDANPITIGYLVVVMKIVVYEGFVNAKNNTTLFLPISQKQHR